MIQNILPYRFSNVFEVCEPKKEDYIFIFDGRKTLLKNEEDRILRYEDCAQLEQSVSDYIYLFAIDGHRFFLCLTSDKVTCKDCTWESIRIFRTLQPMWLAFAGETASSLYRFYISRRFCGNCGHPMTRSTMERAVVCNACGQIEYPKISPCIVVAVTDGDRIVLTKYKNRALSNYALIAGFCEIGESLEDTVRREVMEEVGLKVKDIRYVSNQPWSFTDTLLVGFTAALDGDDTIVREEEELAEAVWKTRDEMPDYHENQISLTFTMMEMFRNGEL